MNNGYQHWLVYIPSMHFSNATTHTSTPSRGWHFHGNTDERIFAESISCDWFSGDSWRALGFSNNRTLPLMFPLLLLLHRSHCAFDLTVITVSAFDLSHTHICIVWGNIVTCFHWLHEDKCDHTAVEMRSLLRRQFPERCATLLQCPGCFPRRELFCMSSLSHFYVFNDSKAKMSQKKSSLTVHEPGRGLVVLIWRDRVS